MGQPFEVRDLENARKDSDPRPKYRSVDLRRPKPLPFEDALDRTKFGKFNYFIIIISGIILNATLMESCGMSFVMPVAECDLDLTTQDKGILGATCFAGIISSSHLWGFLADTKGRRRIMTPTLFMAFFCSVLSSLTKNFWVFTALRYFNGVFISGSSATVYAYLGEFHNSKHRARAIMCAAVIFGIFCILLPMIAWLVINQEFSFYIPLLDVVFKPWRLFLIVCSLPSLICFFAMLVLPESPKYTLGQGHQVETIQILEKINRWNNGNDAPKLGIFEIQEEDEAIEVRKKKEEYKRKRFGLLRNMWAQTAPLFKPPYLRITWLACTIQFGFFCVSHGMYMWFPEIMNRVGSNVHDHFNERTKICAVIMNSTAAIIQEEGMEKVCITKLAISAYKHGIVLEILYALGFALIGAIINSVGKLVILATILFGCGILGIACIFVTIPIISVYMFVALLCVGLGVTVLNAATVELYPTNLRAMSVCISMMFGRFGSIAGSNFVAYYLDDHCESAFIVPSFILIICGVLAFFIPKVQECPKSKELGLEPRISVLSRIN